MTLITLQQAADIWGCTLRHIQYLVTEGELVVRGYRPGTQRMLRNGCLLSTRVALLDPADVLKLRAEKKASKVAHCRAMFAAHKARICAKNGAVGRKLARAWRRMPKAERAKWGRRWRRGATLWIQRSA